MYTCGGVLLILQLRAVVIAGLLVYLENAVKQRGWSMAELARRAEISRATFTRWRKNPDTEPDSNTLYALAQALDAPLHELMTALDIDVGERDGRVSDERLMMIVRSIPQADQVVEALARAKPADRDAIIQYVLWLDQRHRLS